MNFEQLIASINPEIYENLKRAVELGKWPDGKLLTSEQRELSLQAVIAYETKHLPEEERSGYLPPKTKKTDCDDNNKAPADKDQPLKWQ